MDKTAILDFDDLCDENDPYDLLVKLHERDPSFKVTLFAIPTRCSKRLLKKYDGIIDWCRLGIHGWRHSRHECLSWTEEETYDKVLAAMKTKRFSPIFKAPNWEMCDEVYQGLNRAHVVIADHIRNIEILPKGMSHYIYNRRLREDRYTRLHGHIQPWGGTGLTENAEEFGVNPKYLLPEGTTYGFCLDAATTDPLLAE